MKADIPMNIGMKAANDASTIWHIQKHKDQLKEIETQEPKGLVSNFLVVKKLLPETLSSDKKAHEFTQALVFQWDATLLFSPRFQVW